MKNSASRARSARSPDPIQILRYPRAAFLFAPATIRLQLRLQPIATDRCVVLIVDGPFYYRRSGWTIPGDATPPLTHKLEFPDLPPGDYAIVAGIGSEPDERCDHVRAQAEDRVTVQ